jgi:hypothetical protein
MEYSPVATPALSAFARAVFARQDLRDWLIQSTPFAAMYSGAQSLHEEQRARRGVMKQPFFVNYWWGDKTLAACREPGSTRAEVDAMLFFEARSHRRLAIHVEFKAPAERLSPDQAEAYAPRAAWFADRARCPRNMVPHDDWLTLAICGDDEAALPQFTEFGRVITHSEIRARVPEYPAMRRSRHVV